MAPPAKNALAVPPQDTPLNRALIDPAPFAIAGGLGAPGGVTGDLAESWRRSWLALGAPDRIPDVPQAAVDQLDDGLLRRAWAPLQSLADSLSGTGVGLVLADGGGRVLQCWSPDLGAARHFDKVGTARGAVLAEDAVGTNGIGTTLVTGRPIQVVGAEHFAGYYHGAICTGAPLRHAATGAVVGAVALSCELTPRADLLVALLATFVDRLHRHLDDGPSPATRRTLHGLPRTSSNRTHRVVAVGPEGLVRRNLRGSRLTGGLLEEFGQPRRSGVGGGVTQPLGPNKLAATATDIDGHVAAASGPRAGGRADLATVEVGLPALSTSPASPTSPTPRSARQNLGRTPPAARSRSLPVGSLVGRTPEWLALLQRVSRARRDPTPLVLAGERGVGKASVAMGRPQGHPVVPPEPGAQSLVVDSADSHVAGSRRWLQDVAGRLAGGQALCLRDAETLDPASLDGLRSVLAQPGRSPVVVTVTTTDDSEAAELSLRLGARRALWVPPLRDRLADLAELWEFFACWEAPGRGLSLRPDAATVLRSHRWPGNLTELRWLIVELAEAGRAGWISAADLPVSLRSQRAALPLIDQVEMRAIRQALQEAGGNRARAAEILGISRATIYRKIKSYPITE